MFQPPVSATGPDRSTHKESDFSKERQDRDDTFHVGQ